MKRKVYLILLMIGIIAIGITSPKEIKAETYNGKYSIEYLLRNYNAVTFGIKENNLPDSYFDAPIAGKGNIKNASNIEGAILVQGNYTSDNNATFGSQAGSVKSFIKGSKGNNITAASQLVTDSNYIDFDKMYAQVVNEQQLLVSKTKENLMGPNLEVTSPGIYTINNAATSEYERNGENTETVYSDKNRIFIKNYDKNNYYVFNIFDEYMNIGNSYIGFNIMITEKDAPVSMTFDELVESGNYTGNIIWNFPKLKFLSIPFYPGNIIAPKADIICFSINNRQYSGTILANSIYQVDGSSILKNNYKATQAILDEEGSQYLDEYKDYNDDNYSASYSLSELLRNYSLVTLGEKRLDSKTMLSQKGQESGTVQLFHATGPVLIKGSLYGKIYDLPANAGQYDYQRYDTIALDLESNEATVSYIKGNVNTTIQNGTGNTYTRSRAYIQDWYNLNIERNFSYWGRKNQLFVGNRDNGYLLASNYINFSRLYNKVVDQQKNIEEGDKVASSDGKAHIKIGGNYVIDDVNKLNEIVFDNFDDNKDKITIITIKNEGDINFPLVSKDTGSYKGIVTNDYYNKTEVTHEYEVNNLVEDSYHGNIVWNIPNATYIKLKENAPFAGHLIAPKADVETPELHFSGCFIVNSLYCEGNTEAHFYPLTSYSTYETPTYESLSTEMQNKVNFRRLSNLLGGEAIKDDITILGDEAKYIEDEKTITDILTQERKKEDKNDVITQILTNPATYRNIGIIILVISVAAIAIITARKRVKQ